ncbi:hypothetical protein EG328_005522 [Venturia inaequalis]|uniref:Uncharacterized protein n=1 Tax=Venturia inaequalis TaxID=5025 RepID=A0A8H3YWE3_VENIN|nr:hypothetical protein EG328_005522 [Venturia inaequalis]KAE9994659.1 hypothetical protein EG327_005104 [Venturia inaequalis]RDI79997.1 hypothetical protein Vi05172_g9994 [Venturia inaequalis]
MNSSSSFSSWVMGTSSNTKSYASSINSLSSRNSSSEDLTKTSDELSKATRNTTQIASQHEESTCACTNCAWKKNYAEVMRRYEY